MVQTKGNIYKIISSQSYKLFQPKPLSSLLIGLHCNVYFVSAFRKSIAYIVIVEQSNIAQVNIQN